MRKLIRARTTVVQRLRKVRRRMKCCELKKAEWDYCGKISGLSSRIKAAVEFRLFGPQMVE